MSMPGLSGIDLIKRLQARKSRACACWCCRCTPKQQYAVRALKAGASGYLTKDSAAGAAGRRDPQGRGGRRAHQRGRGGAAGRRAGGAPAARPRRTRGCRTANSRSSACSWPGIGPTEIADRLHLSVKTVSTHKTRILEKMGMESTADLVRYAVEKKLS